MPEMQPDRKWEQPIQLKRDEIEGLVGTMEINSVGLFDDENPGLRSNDWVFRPFSTPKTILSRPPDSQF